MNVVEYVLSDILRVPDEKSKTGLSARAYFWRLVVAALFLFICGFFNVFSSVIAAYRTPNIRIMNHADTEVTGERILPDLGHSFLDSLQKYMGPFAASYWENIDPNFFVAHIMHAFVFLSVIHPQRLVLGRRACGIVGYIFLARSICVVCTSMPDAHRQCYEQFGTPDGEYKDANILPDAIWTTFATMAAFSDSVTCGDMIFSGHMVVVTCGWLFFSKYCNSKDMAGPLLRQLPSCFCLMLRAMIYLFSVIGTLAIVKSRLHYTVDVVIAWYLSVSSWNVYHRTIRDITDKTDFTGCRLMMYSPFTGFFEWLEAPEMQAQDALLYSAGCKRC